MHNGRSVWLFAFCIARSFGFFKRTANLVSKLGEDLTQFRDASKDLYNFIRSYSWNSRVERLGLDEVSVMFRTCIETLGRDLQPLHVLYSVWAVP